MSPLGSRSAKTGVAKAGASKKGTGKKTTIWSSTFVILCIVNLFQVIGQMMMTTILPLYTRDMGATASTIGFVVGAFAITALIIRPFLSPAFDSYSKKKIYFVATIVVTICSFLYGFADSIPALIAVRMLHGCAMGCTGPLALALVCEALPADRMGSGISIFSLAQALSQAVGPAMGLYLIGVIGYTWTFFISGFAMVIASVSVLLIKENRRENPPKYKIALNRCFAKGAIPATVLTCLCSMANTSIMSFVAIYGGLLGVEQIGLYFTVNAICLLATRPVFGKLADKLGYAKIIIPGLILYAFSFVIIANATDLWMFLLAAVTTACGYGVCSPLLQAMTMACVPRDRSGAASATNYTGLDISMLVGPIVTGAIAEGFHGATGSEIAGYSDMYMTVTSIAVAALILFLALKKMIKRNMDKTAEIDAAAAVAADAAAAEKSEQLQAAE